MLNDTGFSHLWNNQGVTNEVWFLSMTRQRLQDIYVQCWRSILNESSRASLYKHFSQTFCYKQHLDYVDDEKFRYALTRLRVASHRLSVEPGKWTKPNPILLGDRTCYTCNDLGGRIPFCTCLFIV